MYLDALRLRLQATLGVKLPLKPDKEGCWRLLKAVEGCWRLLMAVNGCWRLLMAVKGCWWLLKAVEGCWRLMKGRKEEELVHQNTKKSPRNQNITCESVYSTQSTPNMVNQISQTLATAMPSTLWQLSKIWPSPCLMFSACSHNTYSVCLLFMLASLMFKRDMCL